LGLRDRPAARRNRLGARSENRFGATGIPRIVEQQRLAFNVQLGEALGFFHLVHCNPPQLTSSGGGSLVSSLGNADLTIDVRRS